MTPLVDGEPKGGARLSLDTHPWEELDVIALQAGTRATCSGMSWPSIQSLKGGDASPPAAHRRLT